MVNNMNYTFGFVGCGNMGGALAAAAAKALPPQEVAVSDLFPEKPEALRKAYGISVTDISGIASHSRFLFLAVKPQGFETTFEQLRPLLKSRKDRFVLVSMAAGVSIAAVEKLADCDCPVIRIMPNTPASVGEGMILYAYNRKVTDVDLDAFRKGMSESGRLDVLPEEKIDAASALSGCGPAFVYLFAEALADGAVECGLPRDKAVLYAAQTIYGSAKLLLESGKHPGELKDAVCSPGGTTIVGVHALEDRAFRSAAMNAVTAAYEKTLKLKK